MPFLIELARTIKLLDKKEFTYARNSPAYLAEKHPDLWEKWLIHLDKLSKKRSDSSKYWKRTIREMRYWKDQDLDYMYQRVMILSRRILKNQQFEVKMHSGGGTIPDGTSILNRFVEYSDKLLLEIYPLILRLVHYQIGTREIYTKSVRGNINWNKTILNTIKISTRTPTSFVCNIPQKTFSTSENLLLYVAVTWIFNDAVYLHNFQKINDTSNEEKKKIWAILKSSKKILDSPLLVEIENDSNVANQFARPTPKIKPILTSIERQLMHSANPQTSYLQLITWMRQYVDFNVNRYSDLAPFTFQHTKGFDTMFELWVLFEMMYYIKKMPATQIKPFIESNNLKRFKFKINDHIFTLHYEKKYDDVQIGSEVTPDYTIEANNRCCCGNIVNTDLDDDSIPICKCGNFTPKVVLIMDAKNWDEGRRIDGVKIMVWYMVQMNRYQPKTGILFFSNYKKRKNDDAYDEFWDPVTVNQENWKFINYLVSSSKETKYIEQLNLVFKQITSELFLM